MTTKPLFKEPQLKTVADVVSDAMLKARCTHAVATILIYGNRRWRVRHGKNYFYVTASEAESLGPRLLRKHLEGWFDYLHDDTDL